MGIHLNHLVLPHFSEIYRCVKMRVEIGRQDLLPLLYYPVLSQRLTYLVSFRLTRSWQRQVNPFSLNALKQFRQLTGPDAFKHQNTDCCICLCGIGPCQALFLAPCSHVYHYKCIRPLLVNHHPGFLCPICRSFADLEASCEVTIDWEQLLAAQEAEEAAATSKGSAEEASKGATAEEETPQTPAPTKETTETYKEPATPHVDPCDRQETLDCTTSGGLLTPPLSEAPAEMPEDIVEFAGYRFTRQQWMELNDAVASARMLPSASPVAHSNFIPDADENLLSSTLTVRGSPHNMTEAAGPVLGEVVEDVDAEEAGSSSSTSSSPRRRHNNGLRIGNSSSSSSSASASDTEDGVLVSRPPLVDASGLNTLGMVSIPKRQQQRHDDTLNVVSPCSISTTLDDFDAVDVRVNTKGKNVERMRGGEEDVV